MTDSLYMLDRRDCDSSVMRDTPSRNRSITCSNQSETSQAVSKRVKREGDVRDTGSLMGKV